MNKPYYKCIQCGDTFSLEKDRMSCPKHSKYFGYLTTLYDYSAIDKFPISGSSWNKYLPLLPIEELLINFNEQKTPLIRVKKFGSQYRIDNLYCKDESKNPTGSFKDKESSIAINKAVEWGIKKICVASSGNAAVSTSAYAQKARIACDCLTPKNLSVGKRFLINLYGGVIKEFEGTYETVYRMLIDKKYPGWNVTSGINPLKEEGLKIVGFEIWEDIGVPNIIVVPCGNGALLFGLYKAFAELMLLGKIDKLPQLVGVQVKGASPLKAALEQNKEWVSLSDTPDSIAEGIVALESYSSPRVMKALKDTKGYIVEVNDTEIKKALKEIISLEGLLPEPTAASVFAGLKKIKTSKNDVVVCIQTAGGQKNLKEIMESYIS